MDENDCFYVVHDIQTVREATGFIALKDFPHHTIVRYGGNVVGALGGIVYHKMGVEDLAPFVEQYLISENSNLQDTVQDLEAEVMKLQFKLDEVVAWM